MRGMTAILKKEFKAYWISPMGYIYLVVFLSLTMWIFFRGFFIINQANIRTFFSILPWVFLLFIPAITMRLWTEERRLGTLELILTLPVKDHEVLFGKFLAAYLFLIISLILTLPLPISVSLIGNLDWGQVITSYIGALLLGGAYLSIGIFASSISFNQIVSFILGAVFIFLLYLIGMQWILMTFPPKIAAVLQYLGLGYHYEGIIRGVLDIRDILYYLSVMAIFLYLNLRSIEIWRLGG